MHKQTIWVDAEMARRLKIIAARTGSTMLELATAALSEYLGRLEGHTGDALPPVQRMDSLADEST